MALQDKETRLGVKERVLTLKNGTKMIFRDYKSRIKWESMRMDECAAWDDWGDESDDKPQIHN